MKIRNSEVETAPFAVLEITHKGKVIGRLDQYYTARSGMYGYQVCSEFRDYRDPENVRYAEDKTGGCGYCKSSHSLGTFASWFTGMRASGGGDVNYYFGFKYNPGGNYYRVPLSVFKKQLDCRPYPKARKPRRAKK